jgi:hypothetical protein
MTDSWYEAIDKEQPVSQGDLLIGCPLVTWKPGAISDIEEGSADLLKAAVVAESADVIVMTQACDLEQKNVDRVVVCIAEPLDKFRVSWTKLREAKGRKTGNESWNNYLSALGNGFIWSHAVLNSGSIGELTTPTRVVSLHEIHTLPLDFVESYFSLKGARLRLISPYLEYLSQSFAKFFMRVALPIDVDPMD